MAQEARYTFEPLKAEAREVRLLAITERTPSFQCTIVRKSLNHALDFTALSYTWQNPFKQELQDSKSNKPFIYISGAPLAITKNLEDALESLQQLQVGLLWIDAICIDQENVQERNEQVRLMGAIFSAANRVVIWLGPSTDTSTDALDFLKFMADHAKRPDRVSWLEGQARDPQNSQNWGALHDLLNRTWWRRAWVIQEYVLARDTAFICGTRSLSGATVEAANQLLFDGWGKVFATGNVPFNAHFLDPMRSLIELRKAHQRKSEMGILPILWQTREARATDIRDRLFSKVGILGPVQSELIHADYKQTPREIFPQFAISYIRATQDLYIICLAGMGPKADAWPTWVPDWGDSKPAYPLQCSWEHLKSRWPKYNAASGFRPVVDFIDDSILRCQCVIFDEIDGIQFDPWSHEPPSTMTGLQSEGAQCAYSSDEETFEALFRTIVADTNRWGEPSQALEVFGYLFSQSCKSLNELLDIFETPNGDALPTAARHEASNIEKRWHGMRDLKLGARSLREIVEAKTFTDLDLPHQSVENIRAHPSWPAFEHSYGQAMYHRRVFTTRGGLLGIGSRTLARGDKICILLGCVTPVIIRPRERRYELIGECYVHGVMNGEIIDRKTCNEFTSIEIV